MGMLRADIPSNDMDFLKESFVKEIADENLKIGAIELSHKGKILILEADRKGSRESAKVELMKVLAQFRAAVNRDAVLNKTFENKDEENYVVIIFYMKNDHDLEDPDRFLAVSWLNNKLSYVPLDEIMPFLSKLENYSQTDKP